jgi:tRNA uridine 5-carboxymethylaminomethyl modification enzyme
VDEPYRLFTSRAEFRLLLRQDNAARRLGRIAADRGLLTPAQRSALDERLAGESRLLGWFRDTNIQPADAAPVLEAAGSGAIEQPTRAAELVKRPAVSAIDLIAASSTPPQDEVAADILGTVEVELKYAGYVMRERERAARLREHADFALDRALPYPDFLTLSHEAREKLSQIQPGTLAQASRIPGVSPADLQNLILEVRRLRASGPV